MRATLAFNGLRVIKKLQNSKILQGLTRPAFWVQANFLTKLCLDNLSDFNRKVKKMAALGIDSKFL